MKYKVLKVSCINGAIRKIGDEVELNEDEAKKYIEVGFVEPVVKNEKKTKEVKGE